MSQRLLLHSAGFVVLLISLLAGCGGGGGGSSGPAISGTVTNAGTGVSGITIILTGASSSVTTTGPDGAYQFSGLGNGTYTVTPSATGLTVFSPASITVTIAGLSVTGRNFTVTTILPGKAADGYIANAAITVYSDPNLTVPIGTGRTDSSGSFRITLAVAEAPDTLYIKSSGGTETDTGLPAPTMIFAGAYSSGTLNITPITTRAFIEYRKNPSGGLDSAYAAVAGKLGISPDTARADVVADPSARAAMYKVLSAGNTATTLSDGRYQVKFISFLRSDLANLVITGIDSGANPLSGLVRSFNVTIANGALSGTSDTGEAITGRVQGATLVMTLASEAVLYRAAGEITYGAASGACNRIEAGSATAGLFLATFTPAEITADQTAGLFAALADIQTGQHYFTTREVLVNGGASPSISYGDITLYGLTSAGFRYSNFSVRTLAENNTTVSAWAGGSGTAPFLASSRIFAWSAQCNTGNPERIYMIGAAANRKGIAVSCNGTANRVRSIAEVSLVRNTDIAPQLEADTLYDITVASAHPGLLGQSRTAALAAMVFSGAQLETPAFSGGLKSGFSYLAGTSENIVMSGSTLLMKRCASFSSFVEGDYVMGLELDESGALSGTRNPGASVILPGSAVILPGAVTGFMRKNGAAAPDWGGKLNLLSRTLYSIRNPDLAGAYTYGTITLDTAGTTAMLSCRDGAGNSIDAGLILEKVLSGGVFTGLVHLYGPLGGSSGYMDLYWPVGGRKATYVKSEGSGGAITDVGEAYLTF